MILAPLIVGRKGEQADLFEELRAQGFVRMRVDGKVYEIDAAAEAQEEREAHGRSRRRPAQSARRRQAAARRIVRDGAAPRRRPRARRRDGQRRASTSSRRSSPARSAATRCPSSSRGCSRSTIRWARARAATGSARSASSIRSASSRFRELSLASGAIKGWDRRNQFYFQMLQSLAKHYGFDLEQPFAELPRSACSTSILHGSGARRSASSTSASAASSYVREHAFEGVFPNLERRYRETDSVMVREELAKYLNTQAVPRVRRHAAAARSAPRARSAEQARSTSSRALPLTQAIAVLRSARAAGREAGDRRQDRAARS